MSIAARIRSKLSEQPAQQPVTGQWRSISLCMDEDAGEFFNVGVLFAHGQEVEVRMLDSFDRIKCLFDARLDHNDLARLLQDIESTILHIGPDLPDTLGSTIRLGQPLYASGATPESVVDEFFADVVTLARPRPGAREYSFRYQSTPKLRGNVFGLMKERMHMQASRIIQDSRFELKLKSGHRIEMDVPLLSASAAGTVVSGWYKSPLVVENNLLQASADLNLIRSNSDRAASISVLVPNKESGLTNREFNKLSCATQRQLDRIRISGLEVIEASSTPELAERTIEWWRNRCA
ncbi:Protein of unknown function [Azotobacter beijerinckii]|uniref:DUF3037 domain-containing protein n=1 Tax=Azotobacter beijerinckii TaxID=170623 RepID=A0A1H9JUH0_9GAMM|nr:DUF3037 domain-containing protein [Azotobacter beijerinckii]SEQ90489.1 Protein of unknown function [Azotobacter beijerinckii]